MKAVIVRLHTGEVAEVQLDKVEVGQWVSSALTITAFGVAITDGYVEKIIKG